jgi:hypothetical protein
MSLVYLYACAPQRFDELYSYLILESLSTIGTCLVNSMKTLASKVAALEVGTKTQNCDFLGID